MSGFGFFFALCIGSFLPSEYRNYKWNPEIWLLGDRTLARLELCFCDREITLSAELIIALSSAMIRFHHVMPSNYLPSLYKKRVSE